MAGTCSFEIDRARGVVHTVLAGFFELEDVARYRSDRNCAIAQLGCPPNRHLTLIDATACQLSTQEVVAALQGVIGEPGYRSLRCAMVVPGALAKMQARRAVQRGDVGMFETLAAAEHWLMADTAERVAA